MPIYIGRCTDFLYEGMVGFLNNCNLRPLVGGGRQFRTGITTAFLNGCQSMKIKCSIN